jgi:hypothetical protein
MRKLVLAAVIACGCHQTAHHSPEVTPDGAPAADAPPSPPDPAAALAALPGACSDAHWCWHHPTPSGNPMSAIFATAPDNLWIIGETGTVLQWNGATWKSHVLPTPPFRASMNVYMISGRSPTDMWVAGGNLVYHFDGTAWTLVEYIAPLVDQIYGSLWESPDGTVWVGMDYSVLKHGTAAGLQQVDFAPTQTEFTGIFGANANDVWITGSPGRMFHYDGSTFTEVTSPSIKIGGSITGASATDLWIGGYDGALAHYDGGAWNLVDAGLDTGWYVKGIAPLATNDVWIFAQKNSNQGRMFHWNGSALASTDISTTVILDQFTIVDGRWWIVGDHGAVYTAASSTAPLVPTLAPIAESYSKVWAAGDSSVFLVGPGLLEHFDGSTFQASAAGAHTINGLGGIGTDHPDVWAVGGTIGAHGWTGDIFHSDDSGIWTKQTVAAPYAFNAVWAIAPGEAIAVGDHGTVYRYADATWQPIANTDTHDLYGVWGPDTDHGWLVGAGGTILRWDRAGDTLTPEASPITNDLHAIHGAAGITWITSSLLGPDNLMGVLESSPSGWQRIAVPDMLGADDIHATSASDVTIVGVNNGNTLFRWNGTTFVEEPVDYNGTLSGITRTPTGTEWAVGPNAILENADH